MISIYICECLQVFDNDWHENVKRSGRGLHVKYIATKIAFVDEKKLCHKSFMSQEMFFMQLVFWKVLSWNFIFWEMKLVIYLENDWSFISNWNPLFLTASHLTKKYKGVVIIYGRGQGGQWNSENGMIVIKMCHPGIHQLTYHAHLQLLVLKFTNSMCPPFPRKGTVHCPAKVNQGSVQRWGIALR